MNPFRWGLVVFGACMALGLTLSTPLQAAEHITFKNGYDMVCDHREQSGDRVKLYTEPRSENFLEVDSASIATVETVPDPPMPTRTPVPPGPAVALTPSDLRELMVRAGAQHNLDVDLLASVVRAESGGNTRAVSRTGAQGLMQLMPQTAAQLGVADSFRPDQNINGGTSYLDALLTRYHDNLALALAAYNAGPAAVDRYQGIPPYRETRIYVARVIREFNRRKIAEMRNHPVTRNKQARLALAPHVAAGAVAAAPSSVE